MLGRDQVVVLRNRHMAMVAVIMLAFLIGGPVLVLALVTWLAASYFTAVIIALLMYGIFFMWTICGTKAMVQVAFGAALMVGMAVYGGPLNPLTALEQAMSQFAPHNHKSD